MDEPAVRCLFALPGLMRRRSRSVGFPGLPPGILLAVWFAGGRAHGGNV